MALEIQYDEREIPVTKEEIRTIPLQSPYRVRLGEVPDPDNVVEVRRITETVKNGTGSGDCTSGGWYTGMTDKSYKIQIDTPGNIGEGATFKWSNDGGSSWRGTLIPIEDEDPIELELGVSVAFSSGTGTDFQLGDYWTFTAEFWTQVNSLPSVSKEFYVNYRNGDVTFHSSDAGKGVQITYEGRGSLVDAQDINEIIYQIERGQVYLAGLDTSNFQERQVVSVDSNGSLQLANAENSSRPAIGFIKKVDSENGEVLLFGIMDGFSSLTPGATYYLALTSGQIHKVKPGGSGNIVQVVGRALNPTRLLVSICQDFTVVA
jgi:hypothetical protein